jgi:hypothetical protein
MNPLKKTAGHRNLKFAFFNFQFSIPGLFSRHVVSDTVARDDT